MIFGILKWKDNNGIKVTEQMKSGDSFDAYSFRIVICGKLTIEKTTQIVYFESLTLNQSQMVFGLVKSQAIILVPENGYFALDIIDPGNINVKNLKN
jgi:hypothetical protein